MVNTMRKVRAVKIITGLILTSLMSSMFFGCTTREPAKEKKKIILKWSGYGYPLYDKFRVEESKKFESEHPEVIVKYEPIAGAGYASKILTQIAGGTAPDMFFIPGDNPIDLAQKGALLDLTDYVERDKDYFVSIYPKLMEAQRYNGRIYALPGNANTDVLYYNKKLFDEAKVGYPNANWTWQEMLESAIKLTKKDEREIVTQFGLITYDPWLFIFQNNGALWNEDKTRCIINSPETIEAITFVKDLKYKYHVSPTSGEVKQQQGPIEIFAMGRAAMYGGGRWLAAAFRIKKQGELDWAVAPLPKGRKKVSRLTFNSLGISAATKYPELSYELARFMIRPEGMKFLIEAGDSTPIRSSGEEVEFFLNEPGRPEGENQIYLDAMEYSYTDTERLVNPKIPYNEQQEIIMQYFEKFELGQLTAEEALSGIENSLNKMIK